MAAHPSESYCGGSRNDPFTLNGETPKVFRGRLAGGTALLGSFTVPRDTVGFHQPTKQLKPGLGLEGPSPSNSAGLRPALLQAWGPLSQDDLALPAGLSLFCRGPLCLCPGPAPTYQAPSHPHPDAAPRYSPWSKGVLLSSDPEMLHESQVPLQALQRDPFQIRKSQGFEVEFAKAEPLENLSTGATVHTELQTAPW